MNKSAENLIASLKSAFAEDDIINDGAQNWSLERLVDELTTEAMNADEDDDEPVKEYYAVDGSVSEVTPEGYISSVALFQRDGKW